MTKIGEMRRRMELQDGHIISDGSGGVTTQWTAIATMWGELEALVGSGAVYSLRYDKHITHRIKIRHRSDSSVKTGMRFVMQSRTFNVLSVANVGERNRWLEILAEEVAAE